VDERALKQILVFRIFRANQTAQNTVDGATDSIQRVCTFIDGYDA